MAAASILSRSIQSAVCERVTGGIGAAVKLRALSSVADPERFAGKRGSPIRELARFLKKAIVAVKSPDGNGVREEPILRKKIEELPKFPSLGFERWFEVAWEMYYDFSLDGDLQNDPIRWALAEKAQIKSSRSNGHGEKPQDNIKRRLKAAARRSW